MGATSSINGKEIVSLDCEMVRGNYNQILARVSIVDFYGRLLFDNFVAPKGEVQNHLTFVSGIRPIDLQNAPAFSNVQRQVRDILSNKIVVGHSLHFDFKALEFSHPNEDIRDIGKSRFIINRYGNSRGQSVSLKILALKILNRHIQLDQHDPIEDAKAALDIYKQYQKEIEEDEKDAFQLVHVNGRSMEFELEPESSSIGTTGTVVVAGLAAATAIAAVTYLARNNNSNRRN